MFLLICYTFDDVIKKSHRKEIHVQLKRNSWTHHCETIEQLKDNLRHIGFTKTREVNTQLKKLEDPEVSQIKLTGPFTAEDTTIEVHIINCEHAYYNEVMGTWV